MHKFKGDLFCSQDNFLQVCHQLFQNLTQQFKSLISTWTQVYKYAQLKKTSFYKSQNMQNHINKWNK